MNSMGGDKGHKADEGTNRKGWKIRIVSTSGKESKQSNLNGNVNKAAKKPEPDEKEKGSAIFLVQLC